MLRCNCYFNITVPSNTRNWWTMDWVRLWDIRKIYSNSCVLCQTFTGNSKKVVGFSFCNCWLRHSLQILWHWQQDRLKRLGVISKKMIVYGISSVYSFLILIMNATIFYSDLLYFFIMRAPTSSSERQWLRTSVIYKKNRANGNPSEPSSYSRRFDSTTHQTSYTPSTNFKQQPRCTLHNTFEN